MRRLLLTLVLIVLVLALLLPAGVGRYLAGRVPEWVADWQPRAATNLDTGWFDSRLEINGDAGQSLTLHGRHFPYWPPAWLRFEGTFLDAGAETVTLDGRLGLGGALELDAAAPAVHRTGPTRAVRATGLDAALRSPDDDGAQRLTLNAAGLVWRHRAGPELALEQPHVELAWQPSGERAAIDLALAARHTGGGTFQVDLTAANVDPETLGDLLEAWSGLRDTAPGSAARNLALLGMAGAWQQLRGRGLEIRLKTLSLGETFQVEGRYDGAADALALSGGGPAGPLRDWIAALAGPGFGFGPEDSLRYSRELIADLVGRGWLVRDGDRLAVAAPESGAPPTP